MDEMKKQVECPCLKKAFEERIGKIDNASFIKVVDAFFTDYKANAQMIVPQVQANIPDKGLSYQPMIAQIGEKDFAFVIITDPAFMEYFEDEHYASMAAQDMIKIVKADFISGILINPFSEFHCFLPKDAVFGYMDSNGIAY